MSSSITNYNIEHWSEGFFSPNNNGDLSVVTNDFDQNKFPLKSIIEKITNEQQTLPVLVRFNHLLRHRFDQIFNAFDDAIKQRNYQNDYTLVYPIKVNQQRSVVETLVNHGQAHFGLESGSKPELLAVLGTNAPANSTVICNGYKDREYIRTALIGQAMGRTVYLVVEKLHELDLILEEAEKLNIEPKLGIRVRMYAISKGNWQDTGGEKSKFGLSPSQLLKLIDKLSQLNKLHLLSLLHCHLGSQISSIADIRKGVKECARYFVELRQQGAPLEAIDVGGGLGVDYEGRNAQSSCSINYSVQEYANTIVDTIADVVDQHDLSHPQIITESGRALTAHHAVLVTNVFDREPAPGLNPPQTVTNEDSHVLQNLWRHFQNIEQDSLVETYHSAVFYLNEALMLYTHESISLTEWARCEQLYFAICRKIKPLLSSDIPGQQSVIDELNSKLADKLFCNFSLFQSLPDAWGVEQIFPVLPLSYLDRPLTERGIIKDITCDSDGRIEHYVNGQAIETSLLLPSVSDNEPLTFGIFMVGAYQEILGALHNLFGDTHAVDVDFDAGGNLEVNAQDHGDTVAETLSVVHFDRNKLISRYNEQLNNSVLSDDLKQSFIEELSLGIDGYTYLED
ncbi:MAG: biosynthetic arginine decarboxylase [Kangiellaceae bacterium]|jgi:arginine decarboxylase|nr:biosynthetic arginine decarboxylase [Kangiellaceae bacterium]